MKITKEVECDEIFNSEPCGTEEGLSSSDIPGGGTVQGHKEVKTCPAA